MSDDNTLILAPSNEFGYIVTVNNTAVDDGLSPTLVVRLPDGVIFQRLVSQFEG